MRLFLVILCAFCFSLSCSKGKSEEKKDLPKDSTGIIDSVKEISKDIKVSEIEEAVKKEIKEEK